ncbi:hypothetical protein VaNZ11_012700 [Volvox africanus]|uniref:Generative cell specific-1/HAP2 domain-containing protein n=1 Tax=Volvox africanus TaxID=51714 RepID=A0ABQ5SFS1_9CHLO|nr:hypothetical protein VaNZ11_012700 [Volvox africanus]
MNRFIIFYIFCLLWGSRVQGEVLATGRLEKCVRDGTSEAINCKSKLIVTLTVGHGQLVRTEDLEFSLQCVNSCSCRDLQAPMRVSLIKSALWASYSLQYVNSFNWKPYEVINKPDKRCKDGDNEPSPDCGWYTKNGQKVPDSQGFCCECQDKDVFDDTFKGDKFSTRANLDCSFKLSMIFKKVTSSHCYKFNPVWYAGYQVGSAALQFNINVTVEVPQTDPQGPASYPPPPGVNSVGINTSIPRAPPPPITYRTENLYLSPSTPSATSKGKQVSAKLIGDFATYTQVPDLSNRILMVPEDPNAEFWYGLRGVNRSTWMLLDKSFISFDGRACDKVGTGFTAFRYQVNGCYRTAGTCLGNQLKDLWESDLIRRSSGRAPLYMVTQFTSGNDALLNQMGGPMSFVLPVSSQSESVVTLSVAADNVRLVTNRCPGKLSNVRVCRFGNGDTSVCGSFESGSRGFIRLEVANKGRLPADYTITVTNCSVNVREIEARFVSLDAGDSLSLEPPIDLFVEDSQRLIRTCTVNLYDSMGEITDSTAFTFYTNATKFDPKPVGGYNGTGSGAGQRKNRTAGCGSCGFVNVFCFISNKCWPKIGGIAGLFGGLLTTVGIIALAIKFGLFSSMLRACCGNAAASAAYAEPPPPPPPPPPNTQAYRKNMHPLVYPPGYPSGPQPQLSYKTYGHNGSGGGSRRTPSPNWKPNFNNAYDMRNGPYPQGEDIADGNGPYASRRPSLLKRMLYNSYDSRGPSGALPSGRVGSLGAPLSSRVGIPHANEFASKPSGKAPGVQLSMAAANGGVVLGTPFAHAYGQVHAAADPRVGASGLGANPLYREK